MQADNAYSVPMGYVFNFHDASAYAAWQRQADRMPGAAEYALMMQMLKPAWGSHVLDIGCGTGESLDPFVDKGIRSTGIDPSPYMLDIACNRVGHRTELHRGSAEDLPFSDNAFNYAVLFLTLEFVESPALAIEEACRVTKDRVFIGFINKFAIKGTQLRIQSMFTNSIFNHARFYSIWEMRRLVRTIAGDIPVRWRTSGTCAANWPRCKALPQRLPFGGFVGMVFSPVPRFNTTPLTLKYGPKRPRQTVADFPGAIRR